MSEGEAPLANARMPVPDPGTVLIPFRYFNDSGDITEAEAYASADGVVYQPVSSLPSVEPYTVRESPPMYPPVVDPRYFSVSIWRNGLPVGAFTIGPSVADLAEAEATFHVDPADPEDVSVFLWARDINGNIILPPP